jgi:hypothetical protein
MFVSHVDEDEEEVAVVKPPKKIKAKLAPQPSKPKAKVKAPVKKVGTGAKTKAPVKKVEAQSDISAVEISEPKIAPLRSVPKPKSAPELQPFSGSELDNSNQVMVLLVIYN